MKKLLLPVCLLAVSLCFTSCGGGKTSVDSIAKKWCELTVRVKNASNTAEKEVAKEKRKNYENEIEAKYKNDEAFLQKLKEATQACDN
jgi:outer membrane lipopolysaccharide assembly protein LptE/RlpB